MMTPSPLAELRERGGEAEVGRGVSGVEVADLVGDNGNDFGGAEEARGLVGGEGGGEAAGGVRVDLEEGGRVGEDADGFRSSRREGIEEGKETRSREE
ncbi:unnamed protein product [Linum trigynum]|uniref:Uncharacterized protein n=1 Tax=Linum trigynum TaxID=586398 RepID=A0AAV2D835_9ROSI